MIFLFISYLVNYFSSNDFCLSTANVVLMLNWVSKNLITLLNISQ